MGNDSVDRDGSTSAWASFRQRPTISLEEIKACPSRPSLLRQSSQRWAAVAAMRLGAGYLLCALALALEVP